MDWIRTTIEAHETDMRTWKAEKDPVPERSGASQLYRDQLAQDGIAAEPFYSCIDFRADLADEKRNAIESALMETGFLDALLSEGRLELATGNCCRIRSSSNILWPITLYLTAASAAWMLAMCRTSSNRLK
jgi:hypothetical protein